MNFPNVSQLQEHLCFITFFWSTVKIHSEFSNQTINMLCLLQRVDWDDGFSSFFKKNPQTTKPKNPTNQKLIENMADAYVVGWAQSSPPWQIFIVEDLQSSPTEGWQTPVWETQ